MLGTAAVLAILTTSGFLIIYAKLPDRIKVFLTKNTLVTDGITLIAVYVLLGRTLTALIAAAMSGLFISGLLYIAQKDKNPYRIKSLFNYIKTQFTSK